jgi:hypothetical protein
MTNVLREAIAEVANLPQAAQETDGARSTNKPNVENRVQRRRTYRQNRGAGRAREAAASPRPKRSNKETMKDPYYGEGLLIEPVASSGGAGSRSIVSRMNCAGTTTA